ncbi:hypothetical protein BD626DRAFT_572467 [Schizophyllum amplum]|uniref:Uncharacterized protein n=1 Tax=Schizophyllum amplum TaxID=97359 RepID=A0A550C3Y9_9AGAR|nr:hypothetical protein BD626DRAFT_572466 [Auriculariopsis ampla]TRM59490.1 hypothetical protein BD626DRAFT_572467 [Auriculariopsis ampla]
MCIYEKSISGTVTPSKKVSDCGQSSCSSSVKFMPGAPKKEDKRQGGSGGTGTSNAGTTRA